MFLKLLVVQNHWQASNRQVSNAAQYIITSTEVLIIGETACGCRKIDN